ncbi:MAG: hypothetical protein BroJett025_03190 [Patescibacteria group bacterium]|nr:MAG: hypothetical protein BroJett025_03190 [Patescibacteria group bacterium]
MENFRDKNNLDKQYVTQISNTPKIYAINFVPVSPKTEYPVKKYKSEKSGLTD